MNILELASELADERVKHELIGEPIYIETFNELRYTEDAQDLFNEYYDYYYSLIIKNIKEL